MTNRDDTPEDDLADPIARLLFHTEAAFTAAEISHLFGSLVFGSQISDYAVATIEMEPTPKTSMVRAESLVDEGDRLSAEVISGFSEHKVPGPSHCC